MDYKDEAQSIREQQPQRNSYNPPPIPYVGHIDLIRRKDGGYLLAAIGYDEQTGQLNDGSLAAEVIGPEDARSTDPDHLAKALQRTHRNLKRLRLEAALRLISVLAKELKLPEQELLEMLEQAQRE
jgi:hypothetical protein